ncbi:peptidase associated/transthyretin-like domain-containing protein [Algoriphagus mannitolivorans]|uniref:carboxypeptidase regulatory-like domain-containing protein n=1 Tax=Algoriphagus mannitolivorans TaxID=226504 RepID=UPI0004230803|nr:carboxypeptidase regulatory-like domain-containing protein [Algoriphagus mannitolivorans]
MNTRIPGFVFSIFFLALLLFHWGCREFVDDSFDTVTGRIVDESGNALEGVELIFTDDLDFTDFQRPIAKSPIYKVKTNLVGEFRFVVPSKNLESIYFIEIQTPFLAEVDSFGELELKNHLIVFFANKNESGVVELGLIKVLNQ